MHFLERSLLVLANSRDDRDLFTESFWLTVLAAAFFYCEQLSELLRETDLVANLILVCQQLTAECPLPIHVALFRGFERLLLTGEAGVVDSAGASASDGAGSFLLLFPS